MPNPPFLPPVFAPGPPTTPAWESGPAAFAPYNGQTQTKTINIANPPPPMELGTGPADPLISKRREQYIGSGYAPVPQGPQGIGVGNPFVTGPNYPNAQVRFFVQGGNLYVLDNISGQSFLVSASAVSPVVSKYSATRPT